MDFSLLLSLARKNNDLSYADFICKFPFSYYVERVRRIGFTGFQDVVDVGSGFGQWSAALGICNKRVIALERNVSRLFVAQNVLREASIDNVMFTLGDAMSLPYEKHSFDAVFCYGVFMFLPQEQAINEFRRILRPGGMLYICTNAFGWWLELWLKNVFRNRNTARAAVRAMFDRRKGVTPNSIGRRDVYKLLTPAHWDIIDVNLEGMISRTRTSEPIDPAYKGKFLGFDTVVEFIAKKREELC